MEAPDKNTIQTLVRTAVESYAQGFQARHEGEVDNPEGTINMKIHNVFIEALGKEIQYYTALVRSLDSSLGNMLESLAINIASLSFEVKRNVEGPLKVEQTRIIAELLEKYKRHEIRPSVKDYQVLRSLAGKDKAPIKRHDSDYYLRDREFWNFICRSKYGYHSVFEAYHDVIAKKKFRKNLAEMAHWQGLTQNAL